eukprot:233677-Pelagomonas_calceolata.AAC.4
MFALGAEAHGYGSVAYDQLTQVRPRSSVAFLISLHAQQELIMHEGEHEWTGSCCYFATNHNTWKTVAGHH